MTYHLSERYKYLLYITKNLIISSKQALKLECMNIHIYLNLLSTNEKTYFFSNQSYIIFDKSIQSYYFEILTETYASWIYYHWIILYEVCQISTSLDFNFLYWENLCINEKTNAFPWLMSDADESLDEDFRHFDIVVLTY